MFMMTNYEINTSKYTEVSLDIWQWGWLLPWFVPGRGLLLCFSNFTDFPHAWLVTTEERLFNEKCLPQNVTKDWNKTVMHEHTWFFKPLYQVLNFSRGWIKHTLRFLLIERIDLYFITVVGSLSGNIRYIYLSWQRDTLNVCCWLAKSCPTLLWPHGL